ncbi:MAG: putative Ig domain-containing protein [Actinobacteria bacterium]|nr:putative Ig domain-containing protein [Actinomycetota bacterium]
MSGMKAHLGIAAAAVAALALATSASPSASFTVGFVPMLPPAIAGTLYPPKPYATVGFCRPVLKFGKTCTGYTFRVSAKGGVLPAGMSVDAASGALVGLPGSHDDTYQPARAKSPGQYTFDVCAKSARGTVCKPSQLTVFTPIGGTWTGTFSGDSGAFTCNTPLGGKITLVLTQKVTLAKGVPVSTVGGTATFDSLPPLSNVPNWDGTQNGPCDPSVQTFGFGHGNVANPNANGEDSANGVWNVTLGKDGSLSGSVTLQDGGKNGFFSELSFTATRAAAKTATPSH